MAFNDVRIVFNPYDGELPTIKLQAEAAATAMLAGEPVKIKSSGSPYAIPLADAEPVIGTTTQVYGIVASDSTQTASADGTVTVYDALSAPGVIYGCKAKSAAAADTQSEIDALVGDCLLFDLTGGSYTIDTAAGNAQTSGLQVVGGDPANSEIWFKIRPSAAQGIIA